MSLREYALFPQLCERRLIMGNPLSGKNEGDFGCLISPLGVGNHYDNET